MTCISEGTKDRLTVITMLWMGIGVGIFALITWLASVIVPGLWEKHSEVIGGVACVLGCAGGLFGAFGLAFLYYRLFVQPHEDKAQEHRDNRSTKEIRDEIIFCPPTARPVTELDRQRYRERMRREELDPFGFSNPDRPLE